MKDSEIKLYLLCLGNISKDIAIVNVKKTGLNGYVYDFYVDYNTIDVSDIADIHKYFLKTSYKIILTFIKQVFIVINFCRSICCKIYIFN